MLNQLAEKSEETQIPAEKPNAFWYRVFLAVIITNILVIAALWSFSNYFSN